MPETNRPGEVAESSSSRVQETLDAGSASTSFVMKTRPVVVAAHSVDVSAVVRAIAAIAGPARSPQKASVSGFGPSRSQSPQVPNGPVPVHSLQTALASATVLEPRPAVFVR